MAEKLHLSWENISFTVHESSARCFTCKRKANEKTILHSISGACPGAQLLAVMGSSGAGKTTFLNILAQQLPDNGNQGGQVMINGEPLTKKLFRKHCGYVRQDDVLLPHLTVRETIEFYANLRLPSSLSKKEKMARVDETIAKLGLAHCQHSMIGNAGERGISGGEKRRVSIAVELIRNPTILFLDEPTSGLDARTSLSVVNTLADLAHNHNHTIVCTIHQPRNAAFLKFDQLLLLARGHQIYSGYLAGAEAYFSELGYECPEFENPADFYIDLLTLDTTSIEKEEDSKRRINDIIEQSISKQYDPPKDEANGGDDTFEANTKGVGFLRQIWLIMLRSFMNTQRTPSYMVGRIVQAVVMGFSISILWWQIDNDQTSIQDRLGVVFITLLGSAFPEAVTASLVFPTEREVFRRERKAGMYRLSSYYLAKQFAEFPLEMLMPGLFAIIVYWCVGLPADIWTFGTFLSLVLVMALSASSIGLLVGAALPAQAGAVLLPCFLLIALMLAGFYVHPDNLPVWIEWAKYTSLFYYAYQSVILNQFNDIDFYCKDDQFVTLTATATCSSGQMITVSETSCPITHGRTIVESTGADDFEIWQYQLLLLGSAVVARVLIYPTLKYASPREADA